MVKLQAGAIPIRHGSNGPEVALVTARDHPDRWVFPKGSIKSGECAEGAALRELIEEAGIPAVLIARIDTITIKSKQVTFFVAQALGPGEPREGRQLAWLPMAQALKALYHRESKDLLKAAEQLVRL